MNIIDCFSFQDYFNRFNNEQKEQIREIRVKYNICWVVWSSSR